MRNHDSPVNMVENTGDSAGTASAQTVHQRLIQNLFDTAGATLGLGVFVACIVALSIWRTTGQNGVVLWLAMVVTITTARLVMLAFFKHRLRPDNADPIGRLYAASAFISGIAWSLIVAFDDPLHPVGVRLMILVTLVGVPVASLGSNAVFRPVFFAFSAPFYLALLFWSWTQFPQMAAEFSLLATIYAELVAVVAWRYGASLRLGLVREAENNTLLTEIGKMHDELHNLAYRDSLTGLSNRRAFEARMNELLQGNQREQPLALMLIDVDNFKWINDTLGHGAGDTTLIELSRRIEHTSRQRDRIISSTINTARIGGDEFIVIFHLDSAAEIEPLALRILDALSVPLTFREETFQPSVSIGIAVIPDHGEDLDKLLHAADQAMYKAKASGGGCFSIADSENAESTTASGNAH